MHYGIRRSVDVKLEDFETRMEDKLRARFAGFRLGQSPGPMRSQQGGSSDHKENPLEKEEQVTFSVYPRIRVDFPQWEDGDLTGWLSCAKRYFRYRQTP
ncbi:hypothetical protein BHE74_00014265 [Ensete ventricosum]|nr:hypothetical protein BHE74_00014265 [Ensete ventricosum]RZR99590.1 hypothetical protein BHM03_00029166 [Ensete ventricosum]